MAPEACSGVRSVLDTRRGSVAPRAAPSGAVGLGENQSFCRRSFSRAR